MESKWYLSPGQTLENTKIEDRGHALHVSKEEWAKITSHLSRKNKIQQAIEKEQAHKKAMKEGSQKMTASWDNSVEVNKYPLCLLLQVYWYEYDSST